MSLLQFAVQAGADTNSFLCKNFVRRYESLIGAVRSAHNLTRFVSDIPTYLPEFLKALPANFQSYVPLDCLKTVIDNKVVPFEAFFGKFKDYLTIIEVSDRVTKLYDELHKRDSSKVKIFSMSVQVVQKGIETLLLANKWNLIALAKASLNAGYLFTFKEGCVWVASISSAWANNSEMKREEGKIVNLERKLNGKLLNRNNLLQHFANRTAAGMNLQNLEVRVNNAFAHSQVLRNQIAGGALTPDQIKERQAELQRNISELKKLEDKYIAKFILQEEAANNNNIQAPGRLQSVAFRAKIDEIVQTTNSQDRTNLLYDYKLKINNVKLENAQNNMQKYRISRNFDISKVAIVSLGLTIATPFLAGTAASIGVSLLSLNMAAWLTGLTVGLLGTMKSYHMAFYGTEKALPLHNPLR